MSVAALTSFPPYFVAGDTLRVSISDSNYPSSTWSLSVALSRVNISVPTVSRFDADAAASNAFELEVTATETGALAPGEYAVTYIYTETATSERVSIGKGTVQVTPDPSVAATASPARLLLQAMQDSMLTLAQSAEATVNFNGQSFTQKTMKDLQDAIDRQKLIVANEDIAPGLANGKRRSSNIYIRFGNGASRCE
jgi:hypothetical protein